MKHRIVWADNAKAIGIFLVVLGHLNFNAGDVHLSQFIFSFHMPLFFILSGFFTPSGSIRPQEYVKKSVKAVVVPYLFFMVLTWPWYAMLVWLNRATYGIVGFTEVIQRTVLGILVPYNNDIHSDWSIMTNGSLWFLLGLFWVKCLYSFTRKWKIWAIVLLSVVFLIVTVALKSNGLDALPWFLHTLFLAYPFFMIGVVLKSTGTLTSLNNRPLWQKMTVTVVCLVLCYLVSEINGRMSIGSITFGKNILLCMTTGILGSIGILSLSQSLIQSKFLSVVGGGTITILALHGPLIQLTYLLLKRLFGIEGPVSPWIGLIEAAIIVLTCVPAIQALERYCPIMIGKRASS